MKLLRLLFSIVVVSTIVWIVVWLLMGQDLNLLARSVIPLPIVITVVASSLIAGLLGGLYRMAAGKWMTSFPGLMWTTWAFVTIGFILLVFASAG